MTVTSDLTPEVDEVFTRIARVVRRANEFVLGFVKCNSPIQQRQLSRMLLERLSGKRAVEITLDEPIISLLDKLKAVIDVNDLPAFVNVFGLEKSIYAQEDYSPALGRLNNDRDLIRRACPAVLLIWLPDYALDKMVLSAPDFWAWRSGVYEFPTSAEHWQKDSSGHLNIGWPELSSLTQTEKQQELQRLEELLQTARTLPQTSDSDNRIIATILRQCSMLYANSGNWKQASQYLEESRRLSEQIHDKNGVLDASHELAVIATRLGNFEQARAIYVRNLSEEQQSGDTYRQAVSLTQIGNIYFYEGDLETAQHYYEQSLQKFQALQGSSSEHLLNIANVLVGLGNIQSNRQNFDEAQQLYQQALSVANRIGNSRLRGSTLLNLAVIKQKMGDLTGAETLYQESLQIGSDTGDKAFLAITMANLGELKMQQGIFNQAFKYLQSATLVSQELQSPYTDDLMNMLQSLQERVGAEQFQEWMQQSRRSQLQPVL